MPRPRKSRPIPGGSFPFRKKNPTIWSRPPPSSSRPTDRRGPFDPPSSPVYSAPGRRARPPPLCRDPRTDAVLNCQRGVWIVSVVGVWCLMAAYTANGSPPARRNVRVECRNHRHSHLVHSQEDHPPRVTSSCTTDSSTEDGTARGFPRPLRSPSEQPTDLLDPSDPSARSASLASRGRAPVPPAHIPTWRTLRYSIFSPKRPPGLLFFYLP